MIEYKQISELAAHPKNKEIYGDSADADLIESVKKNGVMTPLLITTQGTIISGHRRHAAAIAADLEMVPVVETDVSDHLDIEEKLIHANRQREKTTEVKAREFMHLEVIEKERAKSRMSQGGGDKKSGKENVPDPISNTGQARDIAAAKVGMSGKTAKKAALVVDKIDELEEKGNKEEARNLRTKLNKSVSEAHKAATGAEKKPTKKTEQNTKTNNSFKEAADRLAHEIDLQKENCWKMISKDDAIVIIRDLVTRCYGRAEIFESEK